MFLPRTSQRTIQHFSWLKLNEQFIVHLWCSVPFWGQTFHCRNAHYEAYLLSSVQTLKAHTKEARKLIKNIWETNRRNFVLIQNKFMNFVDVKPQQL